MSQPLSIDHPAVVLVGLVVMCVVSLLACWWLARQAAARLDRELEAELAEFDACTRQMGIESHHGDAK